MPVHAPLSLGVVVLAMYFAAGAAASVYPTIMPQPATFTQGSQASIRVTNPGAVPVTVSHEELAAPSAAAVELVNLAASRAMLSVMAVPMWSSVNSTTLQWLMVRLPGVRDNSDPAAGFPAPTGSLKSISITVGSLADDPDASKLWGMDESYALTIPAPASAGEGVTAVLSAPTFVGVLHGLQSLSQLIVWDGSTFVLPNLPIQVTDAPRFRWRGLLVDCARHYLPVSTLRHIIDGLAALRMNVMHWHIVDAQSFPFQSKTYPELSAKGAYHPTMIYTHDDVTALVNYGLNRGVRIVPEFDLPGHDAAWGFGYPYLTTPCWDLVKSLNVRSTLAYSINVVSMNPADDRTAGFVDGLLKEVAALFPDPFLHLGGDEVDTRCWESDPSVVAFMQNKGLTASQLQAWFTENVILPTAKKYGKRSVFWEEAFISGSVKGDATAVVDVWTTESDLPAIKAAGQDALISYGAYLDRQNPANGSHWMFIATWQDMYKNMIMPNVDPTHVLGGEASSWGENADWANADNRDFQRLPAVAERLWSSASVTNIPDARVRMGELRCKLLRRGMRIGPIYPDVCDVSLEVSSPQGAAPANTGLIVVVVILAILAVGNGIAVFVLWRRSRRAGTDESALLGKRSDRGSTGSYSGPAPGAGAGAVSGDDVSATLVA